MRKKIIAGNWKMNLDLQTAAGLAKDIVAHEGSLKCEVLLFPSFVFLESVKNILNKSKINIGAQNCSHRENGAFTGEVSAQQLKSLGIEYVLIGHSERREHYNERNEILKEKLKIALKYNLKPVFCCGEPKQIREANGQEDFVLNQLKESLFGFSATEISNIIIAYEPVWAIGTGLNATAEQASNMHAFIRKQFAKKYSDSFSAQLPILYGGSCNPSNAKELFSCPDVDGSLVGGASLNASDFLAIIQASQ